MKKRTILERLNRRRAVAFGLDKEVARSPISSPNFSRTLLL